MKKILCLILILCCMLAGFCGCGSLNKQPVTLAESIAIPENGIIEAAVFETLKNDNKAITFKGQSKDIHYEWILFGSDIKEAKNLNLGIEITESNPEKVAFRFLSEENFGFSPTLSIYLNGLWRAQNASLSPALAVDSVNQQQVRITGNQQSILSFSPKVQTGAFVITPNVKPEAASSPTAASEIPPTAQTPEPAQNKAPAQSQNPNTSEFPAESQQPLSGGKNTEPGPQTVNPKKTCTCTFSIECATIINNLNKLEPEKLDILPSNGMILTAQTVTFQEGESVYDVLQRICKEKKIHLEATWTPMYNSAYVEGIHNLYEFDCGSGSGWMYCVDDWYPNYGCSRYLLKQGQVVEWRYTCDLGKDIGGGDPVDK